MVLFLDLGMHLGAHGGHLGPLGEPLGAFVVAWGSIGEAFGSQGGDILGHHDKSEDSDSDW